MFDLLNFRIKKHCLEPACVLICGEKRSGKSTLFACIARQAHKEGLKCYCQYPYKYTYKIPMKSQVVNGVVRYDVDKEWLYNNDFSESVILLDEVKTIWPARSYSKWSVADEDWFNLLSHSQTTVIMATQNYDGVDLNVRRACDESWFLTRGSFHFTHIEASRTVIAKVADKTTEVQGRLFKKGMRKVAWDICEVPIGHYLFWRKPYYNDFFTHFKFGEKPKPVQVDWSEDYPELKK